MDDFIEIKSRINIIDLIRDETNFSLKKVGINIFNLEQCPFCNGHDCFRIWLNTQSFNCFQCDAGGNIFKFIERLNKCTPFEALKFLADKINYKLQNTKPRSDEFHIKQNIFTDTAQYYHKLLLKNKKAMDWISQNRGHSTNTVKFFKLGWSGSANQSLYKYLNGKNYKSDEIISSGLVKSINNDFFPNNVYIYPHFINDRISHFTFKDPSKKLQYQLPNKYKLNKHIFYGQNAFYYDSVILVEGEDDLITASHISGDKNIAAILGQLSNEQITFMQQICRNKKIYLCFDSDDAGLKYTNRLIDELSGITQIFVIRIPKYKDIDEYLHKIKTNPTNAYYDLLDNAVDGIHFQIECLPNESDILKISHLIEPVLKRIAKLNDDILTEGYLNIIRDKYPKSILRTALKNKLNKLRSDIQIENIKKKDIPKDDFGLIEHNNCYFRKSNDGSTIKISDFVMKLRKIFVMDDELHYECILKNHKNEVSLPIILSPEDRAGLQLFRQRSIGQGSFYFYGCQSEVYRIMQYEENQANIKEVIHYIQRYGYIQEHDLWLFENCAVKHGKIYHVNQEGIIKIDNKGFKAKDVLVYSGDTPTVETILPSDNFTDNVIDHFHQMIDGEDGTYKAYIALGFVSACIYLNEIQKEFKCMPFLYPYGPTGTGKSAITSLLLSFFGFDGRSEPWQSATPDGTFKFMEQLSCLPAWYDEFLNSTDKKYEKMLGITKNIYNRIGAGKGGLKKRQINIVNGCLWISGEDSPFDKGFLSRCVIIRLTEITPYKDEAYHWLLQNQSQLSSIFIDLIKKKQKSSVQEVIDSIHNMISHIRENTRVDNRTAMNYAIPAACFFIFNYNKNHKEYFKYLVNEAQKDKQRKEEEDILVIFFNDISYMLNNNLTRNTIKADMTDNILYICFNELYNDWIMLLKRRGDIQIFKKSTILDYLKNKEYYIEKEDNRYYFEETKRKRAIALDLNSMPDEIRDYFT